MQIPAYKVRPRQRPFVLMSPFVFAHDENAYWRLLGQPVRKPLEMVVEEAQLDGGDVDHVLAGQNAIVKVREKASKSAMRPRAEQQALAVTGLRRTPFR